MRVPKKKIKVLPKEGKKLFMIYGKEDSTLIELVWAKSLEQAEKDVEQDELVYEVQDLSKEK